MENMNNLNVPHFDQNMKIADQEQDYDQEYDEYFE
jgi:hypothetical protein